MLQRADDFIQSGDLSSARLLLRRAAEAGDVHAALTLAGTFDPNVLKALGFQDAAADAAMARLWYERAEKFGSAEAAQRLQQLTTSNVAR
jgi:TPR repeat protein